MFSFFVPIWRLKTVTHESKSCSYCLLSRQEPRRKTKHLITHLQTNSGLFLDGHLHLWQSKMEGCLELFHSGNHADLLWQWPAGGSCGVAQGSLSREMCSSVIRTGHYIGGSVGAASGCHGKLGIDSLCGPLRADSPYAMLMGHLPQSIS